MFRDREHAGALLGEAVRDRDIDHPIVLGLPRGGVVVAAGVAAALGAPLDIIVVRKLGAPGNPELGVGAVAEDGVAAINEDLIRRLGITEADLDAIARREHAELSRRRAVYRPGDPPDLRGSTAVIVDDGLATGYTARAAVAAARRRGAARVVLAVPVAAPETAQEIEPLVDDLVCLELPSMMMGVGASYADFSQTTDREVLAILERQGSGGTRVVEVAVDAGEAVLPGTLTIPAGASGIVVFAHGSGSSRHSPRNRAVADRLGERGLGTLLFDLLTEEEGSNRELVFDISLLGRRLSAATEWLRQDQGTERPIGYFGSSTGGAAALSAAAGRTDVTAVVSRGGRPDLAGEVLERVTVPTLLIVGERDRTVLDLNRAASRSLAGEAELEVVPGAGHLFEEPGALGHVADLAAGWFLRWMASGEPNRKRRKRRWIG